MVSLDEACESSSPFSGVWWHKSWLAVPNRGPYNKVEEGIGGVISN